jgi:hypothetical protein
VKQAKDIYGIVIFINDTMEDEEGKGFKCKIDGDALFSTEDHGNNEGPMRSPATQKE